MVEGASGGVCGEMSCVKSRQLILRRDRLSRKPPPLTLPRCTRGGIGRDKITESLGAIWLLENTYPGSTVVGLGTTFAGHLAELCFRSLWPSPGWMLVK